MKKTTTIEKQFLTIKEVGILLGVTDTRTVYRYLERLQVPIVQLSARKVTVNKAQLDIALHNAAV